MKEIDIDKRPLRISDSHSSKGNQLKWKIGDWWYKADCYGYEGLSEVIVSEYLKHSNLDTDEYVTYEPAIIHYAGKEYTGCASRNFRMDDYDLIPLERIFTQYTSFGLAGQLGKIHEVKDRVEFTVNALESYTGINDFGIYLSKLIEIDALFLNEDRHTNNISLLYDSKRPEGKQCFLPPYYDFGAALFSDTMQDYPVSRKDDLFNQYDRYVADIKAKPFSGNFDEQLDTVQELYGANLQFNMSRQEATNLYRDLIVRENLECLYSREILERVELTLRMQFRKYEYLFD